MKCPHCFTTCHDSLTENQIAVDTQHLWVTFTQICPSCNRAVIELVGYRNLGFSHGSYIKGSVSHQYLVVPRTSTRPAPHTSVPDEFAEDYIEASTVLSDSPKASAALSRRCLQHLIREIAGIKERDLATEIQKLIDSKTLPSHLSEAIDGIRNIGNFAAHPIKSTSSGEVIDVEPGEAEWNLDVLEGLFDFYFVQPEILKARRAALDAKLASAGKPPIK